MGWEMERFDRYFVHLLGANYIIFLRIVSKKCDIVGRQKEGSYINANVIRKFNERLYAAEYVDDYNEIPCYGIVF